MLAELTFGAVAAALLAAGPGVSVQATRLSPDQVREAIRWGATASDKDLEQYVLKVAPAWTVNFDTAFLRVAQLARAWKKSNRDVTDTDVPSGAIEPDVHVYALALLQPGVAEKVTSLKHATIRTPGGNEWVQPRFVRTNLNRTRNRGDSGAATIARSVHAIFSARDFATGNELRIEFEDGSSERIPITRDLLARAR